MPVSIPHRPPDGHKGTFGRVLIIAGSPGMSGAACLCGTAALRSGSGLVTVAVPESIQAIVAGYEPSYMTAALPCGSDGRLQAGTAGILSQRATSLLESPDAVAIGPGLGRSPAVSEIVQTTIERTSVPLILDADALNTVAGNNLSLDREAATILTPHPGEFARLTGRSTGDIRNHRLELAQEFASHYRVIVVLKGHRTIVTDGNRVFENTTGNSGMATGGTGDILTGIIASLCGRKTDPYDAASAAVYAHGLAGDLCAANGSEQGMIASDLLQWLPAAWSRMRVEDGH